MKTIKILLAMMTLVVFATSCATTQNTAASDEPESTTRRVGNRVYINDPYYGQVVLERDPFTGRYYDVTYGFNRFGAPYGYGFYPRAYGYGVPVPRHYRGGGNVQPMRPVPKSQQQAPSPEVRREAREKILGQRQ